MNRYFSLLFLFLLNFSYLMGQIKAGGIVMDEAGKAVPFANVVFKGSTTGTTTNEEGEFYIQSQENYKTLVVSFLGYKVKNIALESAVNLELKIVLQEEASSLDEVVIYRGKTSKKNNPAVEILKKVWENRRKNGIRAFEQYSYKEYEKLEFDINTIDSSLIENPVFNGMEFIFDYADTNTVTGNTYLPVFINESITRVYGDNKLNRRKEVLLGNKNSGFSQNRNLIDAVKDIYDDYDIYKPYIKFFDKSFVSPISTTGIDTYNYILSDSAYIDKKWCYNIIYYPRRENELTFKGNFWVNDTTWAVKKINLETTRDANINWIKDIYIEQDYEVLNDSIFLITRDFFMADFGFSKKKASRGIYAKRSLVYNEYQFDRQKPASFYQQPVYDPQQEVYERDEEFWEKNRLEDLKKDEEEIYVMLDSLTKTKAFNRWYDIATIAESGYVEFDGWDYGPVYSSFGFNEVEGLRLRVGGRTYFGQNDPWRIEGYGAYGFRDQKFKYGISAKVVLEPESRLILSAGNRRDVEQLGANLTSVTDVLGRSLASSALLNVGDNDKLSSINLSVVALSIEPVKNLNFRLGANYREINPASPGFSLDFYTNEEGNMLDSEVNQAEISTIAIYTPGRKVSGYGVEPNIVNEEDFPTFLLNYTYGLKGILNSDFQYRKLQFYYNQPLLIGGLGRSNFSWEAGKTFDPLPLALLNVIPGNQTYFELYNSFPTLDFYEFVTDSYISAHFDHNFNGRFFSRIPLLRELNLRELVGFSFAWGDISEESKALDASGLVLQAPDGDPFYEYSFGIGNILKVLSIRAHIRGNYFSNNDARSYAIIANFGFHF